MKKIFSIMLCLCMACAALGGCGSGSTGANPGKSSSAAGAEPAVPPEEIAASGVDYGLSWYITKSGHLSVTGHMDPTLARLLESCKEEDKNASEEFSRKIQESQPTQDEISRMQEDYQRARRERLPWPWLKENHAAEITSASLKFTGATNLCGLLYSAVNLQKVDFTGLDTRNVTDTSTMFQGCSSLTSLDLSGFDTSNVTDMSGMFVQCSSLTSLDLSGFDTRNATDMTAMFFICSSLTSLDLSSFDTRNVTDMSLMFDACSSLEKILVGDGWEEPANNPSMFGGCGVDSVTRK